jgi:tetratricopeptide (TPR) repeat protein
MALNCFMTLPSLALCLLLTVSFTLATQIGLWREQSDHQKSRSGSVLEMLLGDSRRLFANHFFVKADVYLHSGVYPSIFDQPQRERKSHLSQAAGIPSAGDKHAEVIHTDEDSKVHQDHDDRDMAADFLAKPKNWVEAFGRNFFPTRHTHLAPTAQKEILPWLRFAAELNPNQVETYTVGAYWLRSKMGKVQEAEDFLREGWRANPNSYEIAFELARLYEENRHDTFRARNLFEFALKCWQQAALSQAEPDAFTFMQLTGHLARLEENEGRLDKAILYLEMLRKVSPNPQSIQKQIDHLKTKTQFPSNAKRPGQA